MLRTAAWTTRLSWLTRFAGLTVIGLLTFLQPPDEPGGAITQQAAFAGLCVSEVVWALCETRELPDRVGRVLRPGSLGMMVATSCLGATAGGGGSFMIIISVIGMLNAASELSMHATLGIGAFGALVTEIGGIAFGQGIGGFVGFPLLLIVGLLLGRNRADYRIRAEQSAALLAQHEQLRAEQRRADVLDERARLAREIHDVLAHSLGALGIQIQTARALITDRADTDAALKALEAAQRMASDGLVETRRAVHALRADTLPLHEQLARAAADHADRSRVVVRCDIEGTPRPVPPDATVALLRAGQESLVNAAKHAPGTEVEVRLTYTRQAVRLTITNKLTEAAASQETPILETIDGGYGLTGMRERLRLLRGTLDAGPAGNPKPTHWLVTADLPLA